MRHAFLSIIPLVASHFARPFRLMPTMTINFNQQVKVNEKEVKGVSSAIDFVLAQISKSRCVQGMGKTIFPTTLGEIYGVKSARLPKFVNAMRHAISKFGVETPSLLCHRGRVNFAIGDGAAMSLRLARSDFWCEVDSIPSTAGDLEFCVSASVLSEYHAPWGSIEPSHARRFGCSIPLAVIR